MEEPARYGVATGHCPMKNLKRVLLALVMLGATVAQAADAERPLTYAEAVTVYVEAAKVQLRALRAEVEGLKARSGESGRAIGVELTLDLDACDAMIARLRVVGSRDFDGLKASFERVRGDLIEALAAANAGSKRD